MTFSGWQFKCTGWPWWLVLPLAGLGIWSLVRLHRRELADLAPRIRRRLLLLRAGALGLLILFFLEPNFSRTTRERLLPTVAVLVDQSGSMAVRDEMMPEAARVAEARGLGLLPPAVATTPGKTNAGAAMDRPARAAVTNALRSLDGVSRAERAMRLAREKVLPALQDKARVVVYGLDTQLESLDLQGSPGLPANRPTDFEAVLGELSRRQGQDYLGGVILLTDGRQTAGLDPAPVIRGLHARGATLSGVLVGDPAAPPDAVVAEIAGPSEVFAGENTPLSVRFRITGAKDMEWDLVMTGNGREIARRAVHETHGWEYENFVFPATNSGVNVYRGRLEPARDPAANRIGELSSNVRLEFWKNVPGNRVEDFFGQPAMGKPPTTTGDLTTLQYSGRGMNYAARVRGFLLPPQTGDYVFWVSSDDSSELWLNPGGEPTNLVRVAYISDFVQAGHWNDRPTQKSAPFTLQKAHPCYFEVRHKQSAGEDHLAVGWTLPDGTLERPLRGSRFSRFEDQALAKLRERREALIVSLTNFWKEASLANNAADTSVTVNEDSLKVLLVDATPRWESRYLAAMFERDRRVALTRRYHSISADDPSVPFLPRNQAEWNAYDMVCLGDLDPQELPAAQQKFLVDFVARRGGFLVCLAGPRGLPQGFSLGPLSDLLPVRVGAPSNRNQEPVRVALTRSGNDHPITQVLDDPVNNEKMWPLLPPLQWVADGVIAKPAATVLLAARTPAQTPIVAFQRFGAGRVFWIGTEETWRWRDRLGDRIHQTFWLQAMRWGLAGRLRGKDPRLQVGLDRSLLRLGETAELKARTASAAGDGPGGAPGLQLELLDEQGQAVTNLGAVSGWSAVGESPGLWRVTLADLPEGRWRATVRHADPALSQVAESREFLVRGQSSAEGLDLSGDLPALNRLATIGGGRAGTMDQTDGIVHDLVGKLKPRWEERRETIRLWNNYGSMLLVMALLCVEWALRKRQGLP